VNACSAAFAPSACHANGADRANRAHRASGAPSEARARRVSNALREARARRECTARREVRARRAPNALCEVRARRAIRSRRVFRAHRAIRVRRVRSRCRLTLRSVPIRSALLTPVTVGVAAPADGLQVESLRQRLGVPRRHLSILHLPAISSSPPPTHLHHTSCHRLHDLAHRHPPP